MPLHLRYLSIQYIKNLYPNPGQSNRESFSAYSDVLFSSLEFCNNFEKMGYQSIHQDILKANPNRFFDRQIFCKKK